MKRSIFVATLALTPALLHAQASSPAITSSPAMLQARVTTPMALKASVNGADPKTTSAVRISTGIVAPVLLKPVALSTGIGIHPHVVGKDMTVAVDFNVDTDGKTDEISIEGATGDAVDQQIIAAVRQARYQPGTLDGQPYKLPVHMRILVKAGVQY